MEAFTNDAVHNSESTHTFSCVNPHKIDDISKSKEEELLYGAGDEGDEEDALSDDSMRLRLSDDEEAEVEDIPLSHQGDCKTKIEVNDPRTEPAESVDNHKSPLLENIKNEKKGGFDDDWQEEHSSGNISVDEKILKNEQKDNQYNGDGFTDTSVTSSQHNSWTTRPGTWKYKSYPPVHLSHSFSHFRYPRPRYPNFIPNERIRYDWYNHYGRFNNPYPRFNQSRAGGYGVKNCQYKQYIDRWKQYSPKYLEKSKRIVNKFEGNLRSSTNTNYVMKNESCAGHDNNEEMNININKDLRVSGELETKGPAVVSVANECSEKQTIETNTVDATIDNHAPENNTVEVMSETKFAEEKNQDQNIMEVVNDVDIKDPSMITLSEISSDQRLDSSVSTDKHDSQRKENGVSESDIVNDSSNNDVAIKDDVIELIKEEDVDEKPNTPVTNAINSQHCPIITLETDETREEQKSDIININLETSNEEDSKSDKIDSPKTAKHCATESDSILCNANTETNLGKGQTKTKDNVETSNITDNDETTVSSESLILEANRNTTENDNVTETSLKTVESVKRRLSSTENDTTSAKAAKTIVCSKNRDVVTISVLQDQSHISNNKSSDIKEEDNKSSIENLVPKTPNNNETVLLNEEEEEPSDVDKKDEVQECKEECVESKDLAANQKYISAIKTSSVNNADNTNVESSDNMKSNVTAPVPPRRRGRRKKVTAERQLSVIQENPQVKENGRQRRKTAKNAEEIIRRKFLNRDSDDIESSEDSEKSIKINHKLNSESQSSTPPSLKRTCPDTETPVVNGTMKKVKVISEIQSDEIALKEDKTKSIKNLSFIHKFFQRDLKEKLPKLKQEELEELLIQKIVETITMRSEIGRLREQVRISQKNQDATRAKCQQLTKQIKDFEMVLSRYAADRRANTDKPIAPIKINRSVGLQVNFITEHGMQNLRQLQQNVTNSCNLINPETNNNAVSPRRGIKIRTPRRTELATSTQQQTAVAIQNHVQSPQVHATVTPAALLVTKSIESLPNVSLTTQPNKLSIPPNPQQPHQQTQHQAIVLNGKLPSHSNRQESVQAVNKSKTSDLIDLTDEEEKNKATIQLPIVTGALPDQLSIAPKPTQCFQRVIPTIPGNIAVSGSTTSIRVVQPASQPTPTALVNNMHSPRLAYVMQSGDGSTRQLLITSNANQIRPVTSVTRPPFPTVTYKTGMPSIANGTVRVLTTTATPTVQLNQQHPAPLPDTPTYAINPSLKLPPPAPSLKISKVTSTGATGIVLSWNMTLSDKYADIVSYQLYAYQEVSGVPPSTALWKKVGDVRALPLPMACTLTQFSKGNNYYFAVRAVDSHSRKGQYSVPGNISL